jgi:hypothetical protein
MLGVLLNVKDPSFDNMVGEITLEGTINFLQRNTYIESDFTEWLQTVSERLDAASAAKITDLLLSAMEKEIHPSSLYQLSKSWALLSGRLDRALAAAHGAKVAGILVSAMGQVRGQYGLPNPYYLRLFAESMKSVCVHLDGPAAAAFADKAADLLLGAMSKAPRFDDLLDLAQGLQAISESLNAARAAAHAVKATDLLLAAIRKSRGEPIPPPPVVGEPLPAGPPPVNSKKQDERVAVAKGPVLPAPPEPSGKPAPSASFTIPILFLPGQDFPSLSNHLDAASAAHVTDALLVAIGETQDLNVRHSLSKYLLEVSRHIGASHAAKFADLFRAVTRKGLVLREANKEIDEIVYFPDALPIMAQWLQSVSRNLDAATAAAHANKASSLLVEAIRIYAGIQDYICCASLSRALQAVHEHLDPATAAARNTKAANLLVAAMIKETDPSELCYLALSLQAVGGHLDVVHAAKAADAIVTAIREKIDLNRLPSLSRDSQNSAVAGMYPEPPVTKAGQLVPPRKYGDRPSLVELAQGLQAVNEHLDAPTAAANASTAAEILVLAMSKRLDLSTFSALPQGLKAISVHLDAVHAARAADRLLSIMRKTTDFVYLMALSRGLQAVNGHLVASRAIEAAEILIVMMTLAPWLNPLHLHLKQWEEIVECCSTPDILRLLNHPLAARRAQRILLDVLGRRTHCHFRNTWEFLDWARSNGVEFVPTK